MALRGADRRQCRAGAGALARAAGRHRAGVGRILAPAAADPAARLAGVAGAFTAGARSRPGAALPAGRRVLRSRSCQLACRDRADPARQRHAVRQFGQRDPDDLGPGRGAAGADGPGRHRGVCRIGGAGILLGRSLEISPTSFAGDLFCLLAGVFYAFYLLPAQRARAQLGQWTVLLLVSLAAAPILLGIALVAGEPVWPGTAGWGPVLILALSSQIVGQGLLVFALGHFPPLIIGMALLTQPALAALVGWLVFGETLVPLDVVGMVLVGTALVLARVKRKPRMR
ncbi:MAG: DMT family transporter [Qipengyuania citrea]|uniref:DMT family transporter n=1 Tax=Qipengyuania citrea TaxID=225971 RepID=UPI003264DDB8